MATTRHGYHIEGTETQEPVPDLDEDCPGPDDCPVCIHDIVKYFRKKLRENWES